jgi:hypothetical protein
MVVPSLGGRLGAYISPTDAVCGRYRARAAYDKLATRTTWITYDMTPSAADATATSAAE